MRSLCHKPSRKMKLNDCTADLSSNSKSLYVKSHYSKLFRFKVFHSFYKSPTEVERSCCALSLHNSLMFQTQTNLQGIMYWKLKLKGWSQKEAKVKKKTLMGTLLELLLTKVSRVFEVIKSCYLTGEQTFRDRKKQQ